MINTTLRIKRKTLGNRKKLKIQKMLNSPSRKTLKRQRESLELFLIVLFSFGIFTNCSYLKLFVVLFSKF